MVRIDHINSPLSNTTLAIKSNLHLNDILSEFTIALHIHLTTYYTNIAILLCVYSVTSGN